MIWNSLRSAAAVLVAANMALLTPGALLAGNDKQSKGNDNGGYTTTTPIKHVVIIFQENVAFDHYFATYPDATNPRGEPKFTAKDKTPSVNGLTQGLQEQNNNRNSGTVYKPFRLDRSQNYTCDMNHNYTPEQQAFDSGLMDLFPEFTATACPSSTYPDISSYGVGVVMGYFDGNTVTGLWNYAQHFAMNDDSFGTNFGPSTPGAINVVSGMTGGVDSRTEVGVAGDVISTPNGDTDINDADPYYDDCSSTTSHFGMLSTNKNIGDLLNDKGITWGWFQGGFTPSSIVNGTAVCATNTDRIDGTPEMAYSAHHNPFEYYASTANPHHNPPAGLSEIGHSGPANHEYDLSYFQQAALAGYLPAVSYLKATRAQDGHPGNSSPLDEQQFIVNTLNFLQSLPEWKETAVIIAWDDSDGWYDHVIGPIVNQSATTVDALTGTGACGTGANSLAGMEARCGYGPRLPFLVVSPYARRNFVDHSVIDQSSVVRFIEDNWGLPRIANGSFDAIAGSIENMFDFDNKRDDTVFLDPVTGQVVAVGESH